jgi:methionyl-tRNA synthetase
VDKAAYFQKETTVEDKPQDKPATAPAPKIEDGSGLIGIDQFLTVDLRVGIVRSAARIERADKLLDLRVDLGTEERRIVAGIAKAYEPEALVGKRVVVVANLKPAKLRGVESQGMLLAADLDGRPFVVTFDEDVAPGTRVR